MKTKEEVVSRIKEIENAIVQQQHYLQQMNNQILMFHGAKEELNVWLNKFLEAEKIEQEKLDAEKKAAEDAAAAELDQAS